MGTPPAVIGRYIWTLFNDCDDICDPKQLLERSRNFRLAPWILPDSGTISPFLSGSVTVPVSRDAKSGQLLPPVNKSRDVLSPYLARVHMPCRDNGVKSRIKFRANFYICLQNQNLIYPQTCNQIMSPVMLSV